MPESLTPEKTVTPDHLDTTVTPDKTVTLDPDYRLAGGITVMSIPLSLLSPWITVVIMAFGCFLITQTATLRLVFTPISLEVYRAGSQIRDFPYDEWTNWKLFYPSVPILFFFREVKSIHFLPILFAPQQLQSCLETYVGDPALARPLTPSSPEPNLSDATS